MQFPRALTVGVCCVALLLAGIMPATACAQLPPPSPALAEMDIIDVDTAEALHELFAEPLNNAIVRLAPGEYRLTASPYTDPTCGNCQDPDQPAQTTVGLHIRGQNLLITGPADRSAVIYTGAGYGVLFEDARDVRIQNLSITGGERSTDGNATDGAIVVRNSVVTIRNNRIYDNLGDPEIVRQTVSGVMGIVGREGARMIIEQNEIFRSSWDGIALYRGAKAAIEQNVIDGVDKATGANTGGGRGVGIGLTWDAEARVRGNLVRRYWKGIGIFVNADATLEHNIVEDIITWGISLWMAGGGEPRGNIRHNVVYQAGACGITITSATASRPGSLIGNVVVQAAQDERYDPADRYCYQSALALQRVPPDFRIEDNIFFDNRRATPDHPDRDIPEAEFRRQVAPLLATLSRYPSLAASSFLAEYGAPHRQFLDNFEPLVGMEFEGYVDEAHTPNNPFAGQPLIMYVEEVSRDGARIALRVGEDHSRTWVLTTRNGDLHLRHDHRDPDGTPHEVTDYGGYAAPGGSAVRQSFPADQQTADLLPEAATNVWTLGFRNDSFIYDLTRHGEPRFRAVFDLSRPHHLGGNPPDPEEEASGNPEAAPVDPPGEEHLRMAPLRGRWDAAIKMWPGPGAEPVSATGVSRYDWVLGDPDSEKGRFLRQELHSELPDLPHPVRGIGYLGYDNAAGQYLSIWMDSRSTSLFQGRGAYRPGALTFTGTRRDADGQEWSIRNVIEIHSDERHTFTSYWSSRDVPEYKAMEIVYRRAGSDNGRGDRNRD